MPREFLAKLADLHFDLANPRLPLHLPLQFFSVRRIRAPTRRRAALTFIQAKMPYFLAKVQNNRRVYWNCYAAEAFRSSDETFTIARSIELIHSDLASRKPLQVDEVAQQYFPNRPQNIIPLAIALALIVRSAEETALFAANLGGDSDSVAAIGGAIAGALWPDTVNQAWPVL